MISEPKEWRRLIDEHVDYEVCRPVASHSRVGAAALDAYNRSATDPNWLEPDSVWQSVCQVYSDQPSERDEIRATCRGRDGVLHFAHRMINRFLRDGATEHLISAALSLSAEDCGLDGRETCAYFNAIAYCAKRRSMDWTAPRGYTIEVSSESTANVFRNLADTAEFGDGLTNWYMRSQVSQGIEQIEWAT